MPDPCRATGVSDGRRDVSVVHVNLVGMLSLEHEAPLDLVRGQPRVVVPLLRAAGIAVPAAATVTIVDSNLTVPTDVPDEFRGDCVVIVRWLDERLAVVVESQTDPPTIGPDTLLNPLDPQFADVAAELAVAGCLMHCLDLDDPDTRLMVVRLVAGVDEERRATYTCYVRLAASDAARSALEDLMTTTFKDDFVEKYRDQGRVEGRAQGEARLLLRVLAARGLAVSDEQRSRVLSCGDVSQLERWADRAVAVDSAAEVFAD